MIEPDDRQAELLEEYWTALRRDLAADPPDDLDEDLAAVAHRLESHFAPPEPSAAFETELRHRITAQTIGTPYRNGRAPSDARNWPIAQAKPVRSWRRLPGLAVAAVLAFALVGAAVWLGRPRSVSAQEIVQKAQAATAASGSRIQSLVLTAKATLDRPVAGPAGSGTEQIRVETKRWYQAPDQWRTEIVQTLLAGKPGQSNRVVSNTLTVSDGTNVWTDDRLANVVTVSRRSPGENGIGQLAGSGQAAPDLSSLLAQASRCYTPKLQGSQTIDGRAAYVVDLGASKCPSAAAPETNGRRVLWIDQQTFLVLKAVRYGESGTPREISDVTSVQYNVPIDPSRFSFTPPAGATVHDNRTSATTAQVKPTPVPSPTPSTLAEIRQRVSFPVFVPTRLPAGLTPEPPYGGGNQSVVTINYHTSDGGVALTELDGPAGCCVDDGTHPSGQSAALTNGVTAHLYGERSGRGDTLWWDQEGAYVALSSPSLTGDALIAIAGTMSKTANLGKTQVVTIRPTATPLPTPGFTIQRPTWLPEALTAQVTHESDGASDHGTEVQISYDRTSGDHAKDVLTLSEVPSAVVKGGPVDSQQTHETIDGHDVTIVHRGGGCTMLTWTQNDVFLTLTNSYDEPTQKLRYSCDQLRHVVKSTR